MFTHYYKGLYIHGYCDKPECRVSGGGLEGKTFKSYRAAQIAITKSVRAHDRAMTEAVKAGKI